MDSAQKKMAQGKDSANSILKDVPVEELRLFISGKAVVANDIIGEAGSILLPRGMPLANMAASMTGLQEKLKAANIKTLPLLLPGAADKQELESFIRGVEPGMMPLEPELAHQTAAQVEDVLSHVRDGNYTAEDVQDIAERGRTLARRIAGAPQLMFCLGQVRSWDEYTSVHSLNVALLSGFLAERMFPSRPELAEFMTIGGILHDLGKAKIPHQILNKPQKLTDDEFVIMKRHPIFGVELATESGIMDSRTLEVIRGHHERYNGGGYPDNQDKSTISMEARIAAVADVFDALTAKRVYKDPMPGRDALAIMTGVMSSHFDPDVIRVLLLSIGMYPAGSIVELSDGSVGVVIGTDGKNVVYPKVLLWYDRFGQKMTEKTHIQLGRGSELFVKRSLQTTDKLGF